MIFELPPVGPDGRWAAYSDRALQKECDTLDEYPELNDDNENEESSHDFSNERERNW